ncbi:MAG: AAA family ATPase [Bacteroidetes bacterium]|nr:AAA family ATPase [Bacteroidota bacterium]
MTTNSVTDILNQTIADIESHKEGSIGQQTIGSGFQKLDDFIGGFRKRSLSVIAGRPGMGKSVLTLSMAHSIASQGTPVGYVSSERSTQDILFQLAAVKSVIPPQESPSDMIRNRELQSLRAMRDRMKIPLYLRGKKAITIDDIIENCHQFIQEDDVEIIFIDCLQLIAFNGSVDTVEFDLEQFEQEEFNNLAYHISRKLFDFAFNNDVAVVVTCQISTTVEMRGGMKRPYIADMKWANHLEDMADTIILIYRPEYYGITVDMEDNSTEGVAELMVAKNRFGRRGECYIAFDVERGWFSD